MGDMHAGLALTADTVTTIGRFVTVFIYVYTLLIFAYIITSWIRLPYSLETVQRFLYDVCEPYIRLFRRFLPPLGPLDLSPLVAIVALVVLERVLNGVVFNHLH